MEIIDHLFIHRVANGWTVQPGRDTVGEFTHVYTTPAALAEHVAKWAQAQIVAPKSK